MLSNEDKQWLQAAFTLKRNRPKRPTASNFRVAAIVTYLPPGAERKVQYVTGANEETTFIGTGVCAERSALLQLANIPFSQVLAVYLVSDSGSILTPGLLCRDFITHYVKSGQDIKIVMGSESKSAPEGFVFQVSYLSHMYPYPHTYIGVSGPQAPAHAKVFAQAAESVGSKFSGSSVSDQRLRQLYQEVVAATHHDTHDYIHPMRYAAGVCLSDGSIVIGHQSKLSEYGYTTDAVTAVVTLLTQVHCRSNSSERPLYIMQADQFGVLHAPFAPGRCHLRETLKHTEDLIMVCHDHAGVLQNVAVHDLWPDFPDVSDGLKQSSKL